MILNGRAALVAGKDDYTSEEEEDDGSSHKFRKNTDRADTMKILLESKRQDNKRIKFFSPVSLFALLYHLKR